MKRYRHEYKYYINQMEYEILRKKLDVILTKDAHSTGNDGYLIRSLYFDNAFDRDLEQKNYGILRRKKFRIRIYNHSDAVIKLEKKSRQGEYILKTSVPITREEYNRILVEDYEFLKEKKDDLYLEFYTFLQAEFLRPRIIVDYVREAYVGPVNDIRITFDKELSFVSNSLDIFDPEGIQQEVLTFPTLILEVKYNNFLPDYIHQLLQLDSHIRSAISKYVLCRLAAIEYHGI